MGDWIYTDFYHGLALYDNILPLAIARGKIFGIQSQPVVTSVYIQAPINYFLNIRMKILTSQWKRYCIKMLNVTREQIGDTKVVIRNCKLTKDRQCNDRKKRI